MKKINLSKSILTRLSVHSMVSILVILMSCSSSKIKDEFTYIQWVNPFIGTAPLTDTSIIGYTPPEGWRVWAGLVYPGTSLPNAMVQLSPITEFGSGAGYEYEDSVIYAFTHTNKGHWNLCHIPILPVTGEVEFEHFGSSFSHDQEKAMPGYYQVWLKDYDVNVELTSTLRCGFHRYNFPKGQERKIVFNLTQSNERVRDWKLEKAGERSLSGFQDTGGNKVFFYAILNDEIEQIEELSKGESVLSVVRLKDKSTNPVELKVGLSFVSVANAKENLEKELGNKTFDAVKEDAWKIWDDHLSKVQVKGGSEKQRTMFYTSLYRAFLWPALRSDINGEYSDVNREVVKADFNYYTIPSFWDTYRNKLVLLTMLSPEVTNDVIKTLIDIGEKRGFIPTFFHGDHAAAFITGSYLRGVDEYDINKALELLIRNATIEGGTRPHITEYMEKGYISTPEVDSPHVESKAKAGVTKTLEYAYDDYALALLAHELNDSLNFNVFIKRSQNYRNVFDATSGFMKGKLENGEWVKNFDPQYPYYEYMYREANAWQSTFFVPHDVEGLIALYGGKERFEVKLDSLFTVPWNSNHIARNVSGFIGQYCHGNQPDHNYPYLYYYLDKQEKAQAVLDTIMNHYYGIGEDGLALSGMDDAGEMSSWYVFSAMGFYPFSPADDEYIISVPLFEEVKLSLPEANDFTISKKVRDRKITSVTLNGEEISDFMLSHEQLKKGGTLTIQ